MALAGRGYRLTRASLPAKLGRYAMAEAAVRNFTINFGPQHPAAHGVLRLVLELDGDAGKPAQFHWRPLPRLRREGRPVDQRPISE